MTGIADLSWTALALWVALALTGVSTGALVSRWNSQGGALPPRLDRLLLAAAAAGIVAWFANAGALLANAPSNSLLAAYVPTESAGGFRLAVLWATLPGAALTFAVALLVHAVLLPMRSSHRIRFAAGLSAFALAALGVAVWFVPPPDAAAASSIPPFVQSAFAAVAPLCALVALIGVAIIASAALADQSPPRGWMVLAWTSSTVAVSAEQVARAQLGIGPRDGVVLGSASAGLVLWLVTSALLHRRVQEWLRMNPAASGHRRAALAAHAGAVLLAVSFVAHARAARSTVSLAPGQSVNVPDAFRRQWQLSNQGVSRFDNEGVHVTTLAVDTRSPAGATVLLTPEIREYHRADGMHLENAVSLRRSTGRTLMAMRVLLIDADSLDVARLRVTFLAAPLLWPVGVALLLGSAGMLATRTRRTGRPPE